MDVSIVYTLVFIAIIVIGCLVGLLKGGLRMCLRLGGSIICLILSFILAQNIGATIYDNFVKDKIHEAVGSALINVSEQVEGITAEVIDKDDLNNIVNNTKEGIDKALAGFNFNIDESILDLRDLLKRVQADTDNQMLSGALGFLIDNTTMVTDVFKDMKESNKTAEEFICEDIIDPPAITLTKIIVFIILYILLKIVITILVSLLEGLFKNFALNGINRVIGGVIGLVCGVIIAYVVAVIIGLLADMQIQTELFNRQGLENSVIGKALMSFDLNKAYAEANTWFSETFKI